MWDNGSVPFSLCWFLLAGTDAGGGYQEDINVHNHGMHAQSQMQRMGQLEEREEQARELEELEG